MLNFIVNPKKCVKCKQCIIDCPSNIISFGKKLPYISNDNKKACIKCQHCLAICPTGALSILHVDPKNCDNLKNNLPEYDKLEILAKGRRSTRRYKNENIKEEDINRLLKAALHAPTGNNAMKVNFSVIDDKNIMSKYRNEVYNGIKKAVDSNNLPIGMEFFEGIANKWFLEKNDIIFRNAPHMVISSAPKECPTPEVDAIIALSYFDLLASAMKLGTLWCGLGKWAIEDVVPEMRTKLGIPEDHKIGYIMIFGKPAVKYYRTVQRETSNINKIV